MKVKKLIDKLSHPGIIVVIYDDKEILYNDRGYKLNDINTRSKYKCLRNLEVQSIEVGILRHLEIKVK